jgi:predicted acetyltransferase
MEFEKETQAPMQLVTPSLRDLPRYIEALRRDCYATAALRLLLERVREAGLDFVTITTDPDNVASQKVILANGGILLEEFVRPPQFGATPGLRYRIDVAGR